MVPISLRTCPVRHRSPTAEQPSRGARAPSHARRPGPHAPCLLVGRRGQAQVCPVAAVRCGARLEGAREVLPAGFSAAVTLLAVVWSRFFRRGPLEHVLGAVTEVARFVR